MVFRYLRAAALRSRVRPVIPPGARIHHVKFRPRIRHPVATVLIVGGIGMFACSRLLAIGAMRSPDGTLFIPLGFGEEIPPRPYTHEELGMELVEHSRGQLFPRYSNHKEWTKFWESLVVRIAKRNPALLEDLGPNPKVKQTILRFWPMSPKPRYKQRGIFCKVESVSDPNDPTHSRRTLTVSMGIAERFINHQQHERAERLYAPVVVYEAIKKRIKPTFQTLWSIIRDGPHDTGEDGHSPMFGRIIEESAIVCENVVQDIMKDVRRQKKLGTSSYVRDTRGEFWAKGMVCLTGGDRDIWFAVEGCFNPKRSDYKPFHIQANPFIRYLNGPVKPVDSEKLTRLNRFSSDGQAESNKSAQVPRQKVLTEEQKERLDQVSKNVENMKTQLAEMSQQLQERREKVAAERAAKHAAEQQENAKKSTADPESESEVSLQSPVDKSESSPDEAPDAASQSTENSEKPSTPPSTSTSKPPSSRPSGPSAS